MAETRDYSHIPGGLPYTLAAWKVRFAIDEIRPYWTQLPYALGKKINDAYRNGSDLVITKDDLDSLSPSLWGVLHDKLG